LSKSYMTMLEEMNDKCTRYNMKIRKLNIH